jgi:hypothetical protein
MECRSMKAMAKGDEAAAAWVNPQVLKPWAGNPRKNDGEPVAKVAESIKRFGFAAPIVARRETGEIIAGHTRWKAALKLKLKRVPVRYMDLDEREARLLALADNRLGELAEWDDTLLHELLGGYDLAEQFVAGWSETDMQALEGELEAIETEDGGQPCFDVFDRERLADAMVVALLGKTHGDFARMPPDVMVALNRCAAGRSAALSRCTDRWFPHRYDVRAGTGRFTPNAQMQMPERIRAASRMGTGVLKGWGTTASLLNDILLMREQCARQFPLDAARDIYREFTQPGAAVLDPCAGWGGRLLGWLCALRGGTYQGYDAGVQTCEGFARMIAELGIEGASVVHAAYEDVQLQPESFDFAFTSPPYFTLEQYASDPEQAEQRYTTYPLWLEGFFEPLIVRTLEALRPGCAFVLNVSDCGEWVLAQDAKRIARAAGAEVEARTVCIGAARAMHNRERSADEDLLVLRKPVTLRRRP